MEVPREAVAEAKQFLLSAAAEGAAADAGFDAGEFSGPAWHRIVDERMDEIAKRHGVEAESLWDATLAGMMGWGDARGVCSCGVEEPCRDWPHKDDADA